MCIFKIFPNFFNQNKGTLEVDLDNTNTPYNTKKYSYKVENTHRGFD